MAGSEENFSLDLTIKRLDRGRRDATPLARDSLLRDNSKIANCDDSISLTTETA